MGDNDALVTDFIRSDFSNSEASSRSTVVTVTLPSGNLEAMRSTRSHVNAYVRLAQGDRTPFEVFEFLYGEGTAARLHIARIDPREVVLKPRLVGIEMK